MAPRTQQYLYSYHINRKIHHSTKGTRCIFPLCFPGATKAPMTIGLNNEQSITVTQIRSNLIQNSIPLFINAHHEQGRCTAPNRQATTIGTLGNFGPRTQPASNHSDPTRSDTVTFPSPVHKPRTQSNTMSNNTDHHRPQAFGTWTRPMMLPPRTREIGAQQTPDETPAGHQNPKVVISQ